MKILMKSCRPCRWGAFALTLAMTLWVLTTAAQPPRERRAHPPQWRGDIERFHEHDWNLWRGGHWTRARHEGRLGWWWVVGASWYFYPAPVYPYPNPWEPPPVVLVTPPVGTPPPAPPTQYWYYCETARGYYPYVSTCASGWKPVPSTPGEPTSGPSK